MVNEQVASLFFELLRSAIWNKPADENVFRGIDSSVWAGIMRLAESQKVNALLYDGIMTLPAILRPEKTMLYKLFLQTEAIEKSNSRINQALKKLSEEYEKIDCPFILLKGQGNAALYPKPEHRTPGDIDVFLYRPADYVKANNWARLNNYEFEPESTKHQGFNIEDIHIENHHSITHFNKKKYTDLLEIEVSKAIQNDFFRTVSIAGNPFSILPPSFNAFFIFHHLFNHFIHFGVGFRQFIDWVLFLHSQSGCISKDEFTELVMKFNLLKPMRIFAYIAVKYLAAPVSIFPFDLENDTPYSDKVKRDMLEGGNFGFYRPNEKRPIGLWAGRWYSFLFTIKRTIKFAMISPEHLLIMPYHKLLTRIKLLFKK